MARVWNHGDGYRRGPPARIRFHGFESDTARLQNAGWRIAEHFQDCHYDMSRDWEIILSAPGTDMKLRGRCREREFRSRMHSGYEAEYNAPVYPLWFEVDEYFHDYKVSVRDVYYSRSAFREIDGSHTIADRLVSVDWGSIFPPRQEPKEKVLIQKADMSVIEHLEAVLREQAPKQKELRQRAVDHETSVIAQLVQVA